MSDSEAYLRQLRRALPLGCRRRFVAEVREHFTSAVAAEAKRGVGRFEAERLTIDRLGPAQALADQLRDDQRSGALGPVRRLAVAMTMTRLVALTTASAIAVVIGFVLLSAPPALQNAAASPGTVTRTNTDVANLVATVIPAILADTEARYTHHGHVRLP